MLIKICGLTFSEQAFETAQCGAHYIGIVLEKSSKRFVDLNRAKEIAAAVKEGGGIPVAVYKHTTELELVETCQFLQIQAVQVYQPFVSLPEFFTVFYANCRSASYRPEKDFLLYDSIQPGSGTAFDWTSFTPPSDSWFLAGGLSIDNIDQAISQLKPSGVDASSALEKDGKKDIQLIKAFMERVRQYE